VVILLNENHEDLEKELDTEPETELETEPDTEPETEPDTEPETELDAEPDTELDAEEEAEECEPCAAEPVVVLTREELLSLAADTEKEAEEAAVAARSACLAAQKAATALSRDESGEEDDLNLDLDESEAVFLKAKLEAARQGVYAADAAVGAQRAAAFLAEAAFSKAQKEHGLAKQRRREAASELKKLQETQEQAAETIDETREMASLAAQKAGGDEETAEAAHRAACIAAQELEAQAALEEEEIRVQAEAAQSSAEAAAAKLQGLERELVSAKEKARSLMEGAVEKNVPLSAGMQMFFAKEVMPSVSTAPAPDSEETAKKPGFWGKVWTVFKTFVHMCVWVLFLFLVFTNFVFEFTGVKGESMSPTLHEKDKLITVKLGYIFGSPQRGDIVVLEAPDKDNEFYIKRIIALPGERIEIKNGRVYINGALLDEPYLQDGVSTEAHYGAIDMVVREGTYFVMGDNRSNSNDSRNPAVGLIGVSKIKGKASFRIMPLGSFGGL